jgi:uncharacterized surface protein with fasciclin (FAS1) repeats
MNKYSFKIYHVGLAAVMILLGLNSCSDDWSSHYAANTNLNSDKTIWGEMETQGNLSDFMEILQATHVSSYNNASTFSYAELLNSDQTFTVWAPNNGSFNKDSLLNLCQTDSGQRIVEKSFVRNHIARYLFSISSSTDMEVMLLNRKSKSLKGLNFGNVTISTPNLVTNNGVLHILNGDYPYISNIYEALCTNSDFDKFSSYLKAFQKDSLDEFSSVASGIVDGRTVYVDSVMIDRNTLLAEIGQINHEDSAYWVIAPTNQAWNDAYAKVFPYFKFAFIANADSLQTYWTKHSLVDDLIFNLSQQNAPNDSLVSTKFLAKKPNQHVFRKPFEAGGILADVKGITTCSNGKIYKVEKWPFSIQQSFFQPLKTEAELEPNILSSTLATLNLRTIPNKGLSNNGYLDVVPSASSSNPSITFQVKNTLSGKYDVCIVFAPRTVYSTPITHADSVEIFKPCKVRAYVNYVNEKGAPLTLNCGNGGTFSNNPYKLDTVCIASGFTFPTCNLNQDEVTVSIKLQSLVLSRELATNTRELYIDCVYLKPRED